MVAIGTPQRSRPRAIIVLDGRGLPVYVSCMRIDTNRHAPPHEALTPPAKLTIAAVRKLRDAARTEHNGISEECRDHASHIDPRDVAIITAAMKGGAA